MYVVQAEDEQYKRTSALQPDEHTQSTGWGSVVQKSLTGIPQAVLPPPNCIST